MVKLEEYKEYLKNYVVITSGGELDVKRNNVLNIIELFETGEYSLKEVAEKVGVTQRYAQMVIRGIDEFERYGRTRETKIFSVIDLIYLANNPDKVEEIIQRGYLEHYQKSAKRDMRRDINSHSYQMARAKLKAIVLERDNCTCTKCGSHIALEVHHIKKVSEFPALEFDPDNCITLCHLCHDRSA